MKKVLIGLLSVVAVVMIVVVSKKGGNFREFFNEFANVEVYESSTTLSLEFGNTFEYLEANLKNNEEVNVEEFKKVKELLEGKTIYIEDRVNMKKAYNVSSKVYLQDKETKEKELITEFYIVDGKALMKVDEIIKLVNLYMPEVSANIPSDLKYISLDVNKILAQVPEYQKIGYTSLEAMLEESKKQRVVYTKIINIFAEGSFKDFKLDIVKINGNRCVVETDLEGIIDAGVEIVKYVLNNSAAVKEDVIKVVDTLTEEDIKVLAMGTEVEFNKEEIKGQIDMAFAGLVMVKATALEELDKNVEELKVEMEEFKDLFYIKFYVDKKGNKYVSGYEFDVDMNKYLELVEKDFDLMEGYVSSSNYEDLKVAFKLDQEVIKKNNVEITLPEVEAKDIEELVNEYNKAQNFQLETIELQ
ncbi:MAG: hypothetical protein N4A47_02475 [Clostridia bacterium]|jgi:hypothetical protein|nr:hypothetical protein [Clostridia bacterium]